MFLVMKNTFLDVYEVLPVGIEKKTSTLSSSSSMQRTRSESPEYIVELQAMHAGHPAHMRFVEDIPSTVGTPDIRSALSLAAQRSASRSDKGAIQYIGLLKKAGGGGSSS